MVESIINKNTNHINPQDQNQSHNHNHKEFVIEKDGTILNGEQDFFQPLIRKYCNTPNTVDQHHNYNTSVHNTIPYSSSSSPTTHMLHTSSPKNLNPVLLPPPKYNHPLRAPLALFKQIPICRYHNYHKHGCRKGLHCPFDHTTCHWCLQSGHISLQCPGRPSPI
mmetsp:Transcript_17298/g.24431  ORF Transcript_17298/g.24431 Transcript_17298/m.24431 type:complete len:165 (+) Transcript_17298:56-550(+)